jgi:hypothetical protein
VDSKDALTHPEDDGVLDGDDGGRRRRRGHGFRRTRAEGIEMITSVGSSPLRFLQPGVSLRHGGATQLPPVAWGGLQRRPRARLRRGTVEDSRRLRGLERDWMGGEEQGLYGDATGVFIELGKLSSGGMATETAGMWRCVWCTIWARIGMH